MTVPIDRELLVQAFIVLSLCAGGWMFLVEPGARELRALDAISKQQRHVAASIDVSSLRVSAAGVGCAPKSSRTSARSSARPDAVRAPVAKTTIGSSTGASFRAEPGAS